MCRYKIPIFRSCLRNVINMSGNTTLQFVPFASSVNSGFWSKLSENKLNLYKLDDSRKPVAGFYTNSDVEGLPCRHSVEYSAFDNTTQPPPLCFASTGGLYNKNTIEDFKVCDKNALLNKEGDLLWEAIVSRKAIKHPHLLSRFFVLSFSDLKKFKFTYWFSFPAFIHSSPISVSSCAPISATASNEFITNLIKSIDCFCTEQGSLPGFFLISTSNTFGSDEDITSHTLSEFNSLVNQNRKITFAFSDPSTLSDYPGWPLRNYLTCIAYHWAEKLKGEVNVLCYRDRTQMGKRNATHSLVLRVHIDSVTERPAGLTGWEKNRKNKLGPRAVDLGESMDPEKLAESSVDLNLKLMKWRLMPALDLDKISSCKCLLLGSGTLGCNVARGLLGWGVKNITLVDNGKVSFSNPVRQTLFEFSDCSTAGGRPKAIAAAERLKKIFPGVNSHGIELSIPMPGHPVHKSDELIEKVKSEVATLESLIDSHDVVFLLMDTRESRWLPTLIAAAKTKLVINAALGFDSYLVMRHGVISKESTIKLGCYFCNDVVAPGNSVHDRTLDQQCTVSRPGVSMIAAALAVELMASILQHPSGSLAAPEPGSHSIPPSVLGPVPHQIRGFMSSNQVIYPTAQCFSKCTGCSKTVIDAYLAHGFNFLLDVFNSPATYLEDITGLTQLHLETAAAEADVLEFSDNESV
nr:ubiquitin-like modifier-activating enzyme ATG7 [Ciona intestinalis]|eukprot:XP_002119661.2 ubiquitin-like modifier-activating enzyme ATG7 [Ciona intestinalis]